MHENLSNYVQYKGNKYVKAIQMHAFINFKFKTSNLSVHSLHLLVFWDPSTLSY